MGISHPIVAIVIFNRTRQTLVLVKQFRPAVFFSELMSRRSKAVEAEDLTQVVLDDYVDQDVIQKGITLELCAGLVDKAGKSLSEIATEEVEEECGFRLSRPIQQIQSFLGDNGNRNTLFYAQVSEE